MGGCNSQLAYCRLLVDVKFSKTQKSGCVNLEGPRFSPGRFPRSAPEIQRRENATRRLSMGVIPSCPPAAITTNCLPFTSYVIGTERALVGRLPRHSSLPVSTS